MFGNRSPRGSHHWSTVSIQLMSLWRPHIQNPSGGIAISNLVLLGLIHLLSSGSLEQQAWSTQSTSRSSQQSHWWDAHHPHFFLHNYSRFFINSFFLFMCMNWNGKRFRCFAVPEGSQSKPISEFKTNYVAASNWTDSDDVRWRASCPYYWIDLVCAEIWQLDTQFASLLLRIRFYSVTGMAGMHLAKMLMTRIIKAIRASIFCWMFFYYYFHQTVKLIAQRS